MTRRYRIRTFSQLVAAIAVWQVNLVSVNQISKLNLPSFSGDYLSWQTFWNSFSAAVDSSLVLSGVQKFNYLRTLLKPDATRAKAGFPLTDVNYLHSIEILKKTFGQTQKIVNAHMQSLLNYLYRDTLWLISEPFMILLRVTSKDCPLWKLLLVHMVLC